MEIILVTTSKLIRIIFKKSIILLVTYSWNKNYNKDKFYVIFIVNFLKCQWLWSFDNNVMSDAYVMIRFLLLFNR